MRIRPRTPPRRTSRHQARGFVPAAMIDLPPGAPRRLRMIADRVRWGQVLGAELAERLVEVRRSRREIVLIFDEPVWARAARHQRAQLTRQGRTLLGDRDLAIGVVSPRDALSRRSATNPQAGKQPGTAPAAERRGPEFRREGSPR